MNSQHLCRISVMSKITVAVSPPDFILASLCVPESHDADCAGALQAARTQQMWFRDAHHLYPQPKQGRSSSLFQLHTWIVSRTPSIYLCCHFGFQPSRCVNQIEDVCRTIEKTINQTVQNTLNSLERDCELIGEAIADKLSNDRYRFFTNNYW